MFKHLFKKLDMLKKKKFVSPLGRWNFNNKPYLVKNYDNCFGNISERDFLEFETTTNGCIFTNYDYSSTIYCIKCFSFLPSNIDNNYFINNKLHKKKCLIKNI